MQDMDQQKHLITLREVLTEHFDLEELRTLCFDLGVDYDSLPAEGKAGKARELVSYMNRRNCLLRLVQTGQCLRPDVLWGQAIGSMVSSGSRSSIDLISWSPKFPFDEPYHDNLPERDQAITLILEALKQPRQGSMVMVSGLGGIGKTALAVEVARRCAQSQERSFRVILWASAKQEMFLEGGIARLCDAVIDFAPLVDSLGRQLEGREFAARTEQEKLESLAIALHTRPCLVILDNLETMANAQEIVARLHNLIGGPSRLLLTSREVVTSGLFKVELNNLSESSSIEFLKQEGQRRNLPEIAEADHTLLGQIYQDTHGMPLAMKLIVGQAEVLGLDYALENLRRGRGNIYSFIFLGSWQRLSDTAKMLLMYLGTTSGVVSRKELDQALEVSGDDLNEAILQLTRLSLISVQPLEGLKQRGYSVHQLTRYFVVNDLAQIWAEQGLV